MILVVDSGSTKTDWIALDKNGKERCCCCSYIWETRTLSSGNFSAENQVQRPQNQGQPIDKADKTDFSNSDFKALEKSGGMQNQNMADSEKSGICSQISNILQANVFVEG